MNILITGCNGQLGNEICYAEKNVPILERVKHKFIYTDISVEHESNSPTFRCAKLDITNFEDVKALVKEEKVDLIINCAAYTNVDKAETDKDTAFKVNADAVQNLSLAALLYNAKLIQISTDYVFNGENWKPYTEDQPAMPLGVYGNTKYGGEQFATKILNNNAIIIRTAWLYSNFGKNFVRTMVNLGQTKNEVKVIFDQIGTPTFAQDLANVILKIALGDKWAGGIYNYTNEGICSWYDFAIEIMNTYNLNCKVIPIHTNEYPTPAKRPHYSVLDKTKIKEIYNIEIPYWKDSLKECAKCKFV